MAGSMVLKPTIYCNKLFRSKVLLQYGPKGLHAFRSAKVEVSTFSNEEQPKRVSLIRIGRGSEILRAAWGFHPLKG
jgi:hypothetical protein